MKIIHFLIIISFSSLLLVAEYRNEEINEIAISIFDYISIPKEQNNIANTVREFQQKLDSEIFYFDELQKDFLNLRRDLKHFAKVKKPYSLEQITYYKGLSLRNNTNKVERQKTLQNIHVLRRDCDRLRLEYKKFCGITAPGIVAKFNKLQSLNKFNDKQYAILQGFFETLLEESIQEKRKYLKTCQNLMSIDNSMQLCDQFVIGKYTRSVNISSPVFKWSLIKDNDKMIENFKKIMHVLHQK